MTYSDLPLTYQLPLAYDIINARGTAEEVSGLERIAARFVLEKSWSQSARSQALRLSWLEPMCGSGRFVRSVARKMARHAGAETSNRSDVSKTGRVVGVDISPAMIEFCRSRVDRLGRDMKPFPRFELADVRELDPAAIGSDFDFAFCLHNSVRHMLSDHDLIAHLRAVGRVLQSGGVYAVGMELTPISQMFPSEAVYTGRRGNVHVREVFSYLPPENAAGELPMETVISIIEITRKTRSGEIVESAESKYPLRCWTIEEWRRLVRQAGFVEVAVVDSFGHDLPTDYERYAIRVLKRASA